MARVKENTLLKSLFRWLLVNEEVVNTDNNSEYKPSEYIKNLTKSISNQNAITLKEERNSVVPKVNGIKTPKKEEKNNKLEEPVIDNDKDLTI